MSAMRGETPNWRTLSPPPMTSPPAGVPSTLPTPPTRITKKLSTRKARPANGASGISGLKRAPARPASAEPTKNDTPLMRWVLIPSAAAISRLWIAARICRPNEVR